MQTSFIDCVIENGFLKSLQDKNSGQNYIAPNELSPLLSIRVGGKTFLPNSMEVIGSEMMIHYNQTGTQIKVGSCELDTHLTFEIISVDSDCPLELVVWGPYSTTIGQVIGDTIGVVRNSRFAIGIQSLNQKTLGGFPETEDDITPSYSIFDQDSYTDISSDFQQEKIFRGNTAKGTDFGSVLQAYCRNRSRERMIPNWNYETYTVPAFEDGGIIGSKIALFGCPTQKVLDIIGSIEIAEGLPHPTINGQWAKESYEATAAYLIADFSEGNIHQALELVKKAGLSYLYHSSPFKNWGHFELKLELFPNGWDGFKNCVKAAAQSDVQIGFHTLSNFVTTNDPYVTPVPDRRLAKVGSTYLKDHIDDIQTDIWIENPIFFKQETELNAILIENELISYEKISHQAPWKLINCRRGAWGTDPSSHKKGCQVGKLADHGYKVFLTDLNLSKEISERIADFCSYTGATQISFDGLEGNFSTGLGQYGRTLFTMAWYEKLDPHLRGKVINDASNPGHFNWHVYTRMNWGEPWYAGFRESQTQYRLKNQDYFSRNLMPHMLGWFALREETSVEDAEWLLARAAGFDAGFALAMSLDSSAQQQADDSSVGKTNNNVENIIEAVSRWETARMSGAFPKEIKRDLQDIDKEFHLKSVSGVGDQWDLFPIYSHKEKFQLMSNTGRESSVTCKINNPYQEQYLSFTVEIRGDSRVSGLTIGTSENSYIQIERQLLPGEIAKFEGFTNVVFYSNQWQKSGQQDVDPSQIWVKSGYQDIEIKGQVGGNMSDIHIEFRTMGPPIRLRSS